MKKISFMFLSFLCLLFVKTAFAANLQDSQVKDLNKIAVAEIKTYNNGTLMQMFYVGTGTQAAVNITSGTLTVQVPIGTTNISYNLTDPSYDTLGELCDAINALANYNCSLTGGKRDDSSVLLDFVTAAVATDCKAVGGYSITIDTGGITETDPYIMRIGITPQSGRSVILKYCSVQNDGAGTLTIYGKLAKYEGVNDGVTRNDTTLIGTYATANDTAESDGDLYVSRWYEFAKDAHVVISAGNATTTQTSTSFLECLWEEK